MDLMTDSLPPRSSVLAMLEQGSSLASRQDTQRWRTSIDVVSSVLGSFPVSSARRLETRMLFTCFVVRSIAIKVKVEVTAQRSEDTWRKEEKVSKEARVQQKWEARETKEFLGSHFKCRVCTARWSRNRIHQGRTIGICGERTGTIANMDYIL